MRKKREINEADATEENVQEKGGGVTIVSEIPQDLLDNPPPMPDMQQFSIPRRSSRGRTGEELSEGGNLASGVQAVPRPCS